MLDPRVPLVLATNAVAVIRTPQVIRLAKETLSATSPRFQRHLKALECRDKRQWTTVERICSEMITTEKDYVADIAALVEQFLDPLDAFADRFCDTKAELPAFTALRGAAHFILAVHQDLLQMLEPPRRQSRVFTFDRALGGSVNSPGGAGPMEAVTRVTKAFEVTVEYMKVYAQYCANYLPAADELKANAKLLDAFTLTQTCSENEIPCDPVTDLIKPVQRICRYTLLFRALVLNATSPEEAILSQRALENVQRVSDLVNARVREAENNARLLVLHRSIDSTKSAAKLQLIRPGRTLLCEMTAAVQKSTDRYARIARALHLPARFHEPELKKSFEKCDTISVNSEMELLDVYGEPNGESERRASALRESITLSSPYSKDWQRLILLSDALLIAKRGTGHLRVRTIICLSCATVIEASEKEQCAADDRPDAGVLSFALLASKVGRCNCHNLIPSTLKRPQRRRGSVPRSSHRASIDDRGSTDVRTSVDGNDPDALTLDPASPESPSRLRPRRTTRQYIIHCESEAKKKEFVTLLRCAIARCARTKDPPRPSVNLIVPKLPVKLWHSIKHGDFTHTFSLSYSSFRRRHPNATPSILCEGDSTEESKSDAAPHHPTDRLLGSPRSMSAISGAA